MAMRDSRRRPSRGLLALLLLASLTVITLDVRGGAGSPVDPLRAGTAEVLGPVEGAVATVVRPFTSLPELVASSGDLRAEVARLEAQNAVLRGRLAGSAHARNRAAELDGLLARSARSGHALVPARVVAMGPAQSFSRTVTIDAGTSSGVFEDMTVVNSAGLVGRVIRAQRSTATVLLVVDRDSVVGGRLGSSMEVGFVRGQGSLDDDGSLEFELVDRAVTVTPGDVVLTWGSARGGPYVAGVPVGRVTAVHNSPRRLAVRASLTPFVDFSALDLVGVVVPDGTEGDRAVLGAGGDLGGRGSPGHAEGGR
jgi:rod shape-determining protein MreC